MNVWCSSRLDPFPHPDEPVHVPNWLNRISHNSYADNIQTYIAVSPNNYSNYNWTQQAQTRGDYIQLQGRTTNAYLQSKAFDDTKHTKNLRVLADSDLRINSHIKMKTK